MATKKVKKANKKVVSKNVCTMCGSHSCHCMMWLCAASSVFFVLALLGLFKGFAVLVFRIDWWVWLLVSIVLGWKPLQMKLQK